MTFMDLKTLFRNLEWDDGQWIVVFSLQLYHEKNNASSIKLSSLNLWKQLLTSQCKQMIISQITKNTLSWETKAVPSRQVVISY